MMHQSIATIDSPEFINLQPLEINPLMSSCEIKVLYIGENRNHSFITKEVATEMAKTLRGAPIVGYYKEEKEDFRDHGEKMIIDENGVSFECQTKPYGFVSPDAEVWFQKFEDTDDFGNKVEREYLMTTGYLWTGQYEEANLAITEGRPQSMELDEETLDGHWSTDSKTGMDFFIINDAIFSKLCILGEDVEPCFEGARITANSEAATSYTKIDNDFKNTLYTMMQDLKFALKGGDKMDLEEKVVETETIEENTEIVEEETEKAEEEVIETTEEVVEETPADEEIISEETPESIETNVEAEEATAEFTKEEETEDNANEDENSESTEDYSLEEENYKEKYEELKVAHEELETKYQALVDFKQAIDTEKKDELINSFYMLSDEDKKDVIENKLNYSLEEIEAKLSVICVRKKVNFEKDDQDKNEKNIEDKNVMTYTVNSVEETSVPAWVSALRTTVENRENN